MEDLLCSAHVAYSRSFQCLAAETLFFGTRCGGGDRQTIRPRRGLRGRARAHPRNIAAEPRTTSATAKPPDHLADHVFEPVTRPFHLSPGSRARPAERVRPVPASRRSPWPALQRPPPADATSPPGCSTASPDASPTTARGGFLGPAGGRRWTPWTPPRSSPPGRVPPPAAVVFDWTPRRTSAPPRGRAPTFCSGPSSSSAATTQTQRRTSPNASPPTGFEPPSSACPTAITTAAAITCACSASTPPRERTPRSSAIFAEAAVDENLLPLRPNHGSTRGTSPSRWRIAPDPAWRSSARRSPRAPSLSDVVDEVATLVAARADLGLNHGVVLVEDSSFNPEMAELMEETAAAAAEMAAEERRERARGWGCGWGRGGGGGGSGAGPQTKAAPTPPPPPPPPPPPLSLSRTFASPSPVGFSRRRGHPARHPRRDACVARRTVTLR